VPTGHSSPPLLFSMLVTFRAAWASRGRTKRHEKLQAQVSKCPICPDVRALASLFFFHPLLSP
jgi:hypothetical protein